MPLDDMIEKLGIEEENKAMEVVANVLTHLPAHDSFPKYALLMGFNWYMLAQVDFYTPPYSSDEQYPEWYEVKTNLEVVGFTQDEYHFIPDILKNTALIRELHVYGELAPIGSKKDVQHQGLGQKLMQEATKIAKAQGYKKIAVISGVGARDYYRKLNFKLKNTYMIKNI